MMKVAMMMNWLDVQNTNDRPVTVVMKKFLCEAREVGVGWENIALEHSRTLWGMEHSRIEPSDYQTVEPSEE